MIYTTINEFKFTKHYAQTPDQRFNQRMLGANILNNFPDMDKAKYRFKRVMLYLGLQKLDNLMIANNAIGLVLGNIFFKDGGRLVQAQLEIDGGRLGNVFIFPVLDREIVTVKLLPINATNQELLNSLAKENSDKTITNLYDINGNTLDLKTSKRTSHIINLDISDEEFDKEYPYPVLKMNDINIIAGLSAVDKLKSDEQSKIVKPEIKFTQKIVTDEASKILKEKEFVIYAGLQIYVSYPDGPKLKTIKKLIVDEKGSSRKFALEFENTLKPMELNIGTTFIISPELANEQYLKLLDLFELQPGDKFNFQGPITKFNFYKLGKGGSKQDKLGIIISPRMYF